MIDLFEILVYGDLHMINCLMLKNIWLDHANRNCKKWLIDKPVEECNEDIDRNNMVYNATLYDAVCFYFCWYTIKNGFNALSY